MILRYLDQFTSAVESLVSLGCVQIQGSGTLATVKTVEVKCVAMVKGWPIRRVSSPPSKRSIFSTSASKSAKMTPAKGPANTCSISITLTPLRGIDMFVRGEAAACFSSSTLGASASAVRADDFFDIFSPSRTYLADDG